MRRLLLLSFALGLSACGGSIETRISSAGMENIGSLEYQLPKQGEDKQNADYAKAQQLMVEALSARNIRQSKTAPVLMQLTLSQRPAHLGLKKGEGDSARVISAPKEKKPFQSCKDKEYRIGIRFSNISDGSVLYSGDAAEYHCNATLSEALPAMVDAIAADMDGPRGDKTLRRRGKE